MVICEDGDKCEKPYCKHGKPHKRTAVCGRCVRIPNKRKRVRFIWTEEVINVRRTTHDNEVQAG